MFEQTAAYHADGGSFAQRTCRSTQAQVERHVDDELHRSGKGSQNNMKRPRHPEAFDQDMAVVAVAVRRSVRLWIPSGQMGFWNCLRVSVSLFRSASIL